MREWTEKHIRELVDDEFKRFKLPEPSPEPELESGTIINYYGAFGSGAGVGGAIPFDFDVLVNEHYMIEWVEYVGEVEYNNKKWSRYKWCRYVNNDPLRKELPPLAEQKAIVYNGIVVPLLGYVITNYPNIYTTRSPLPATLGVDPWFASGYRQTNIFAMKNGLKFPVLHFLNPKPITILNNGNFSEFPEVIQYDPSRRVPIKVDAYYEYCEHMFAIDPNPRAGFDHWDYAQGTVYNCELYFDFYKPSR